MVVRAEQWQETINVQKARAEQWQVNVTINPKSPVTVLMAPRGSGITFPSLLLNGRRGLEWSFVLQD